jgi:hypothetical protein
VIRNLTTHHGHLLSEQASTSGDPEIGAAGPAHDDGIRLPESMPGWKYDGILYFSRVLSLFTATAAVLCALVHALSAYRTFKYHQDVSHACFR